MSSREAGIVGGLCLLAALRVFLFCAAFPFFNNVDEQSHFDLVYKYSRGHVPATLERRDAEAARTIVLYATPEYFFARGQYPEGIPPRFRWPASAEATRELERLVAESSAKVNFESTQPPVYYVVAGAWYRIGEWLGMRGGSALYWIRFLNVLLCAGLTALAYAFARTCFPDRAFLRLGLPFVVAFFPQDAFFAVNNDILLPLTSGAAFLGLVHIERGRSKGMAVHAATGLMIGAAVLVKFSSVAILPVSLVMVALGIHRLRDPREKSVAIVRGAVLFAAAAVPIGAWCARNYAVLSDVTGSMTKARFLHWTLKPVAAMFDHPLLTGSGLVLFWRETLVTFWRGEFVWGLKGMASAGWDLFYSGSSFLFLAVAIVAPLTFRKNAKASQRDVLWPSLALFLLSLGFLAAVSMMFDFGDCAYPSRDKPYMTSGRLALGALIPFVALYLYGLDALLPEKFPPYLRWAVLIVPVALMTVSEVLMSQAAFRSPYNWFHLP